MKELPVDKNTFVPIAVGGRKLQWLNKKVLVCGIARSGMAAALLLKEMGAQVTASDIKERAKIEKEAEKLERAGIELFTGKNPDEIIEQFDIIIISPGIPFDIPLLDKARKKGIKVWSEIELGYSLCKARIIGITGTNGKTTTTTLTGEIFEKYFEETYVVGNIGVAFCEKAAKATIGGIMIAEISSFQLEATENFKPHISVVLNITPDHLNRHKTMENYIKTKERIFENQTADDFLILNYDDDNCRTMGLKTDSRVLFFSRKEMLNEGIFLNDDNIYIKWDDIDEALITVSELLIFGNHNIENVMASAGIAVCTGIPIDIIRDALRRFKGVEHRIEYVRTVNGVDFYNDSKATNADASIRALEAMDKPVVLIGGGRDKTGDFRDWIKLFEGRVKHIIAIGEAADLIIETCVAYNFMNCEKANSMKDAVDVAFANAESGDCVLLSPACASFDMFDNYEQRGEIFKSFVMDIKEG